MRHFAGRCLVSFLVLVLAALPARAQNLKDRKIGVVLMHGKWSAPQYQGLYKLTYELERAGVLVEKPEMPWSKSRHYDASYEDAMKEIDTAVAKLKAKGAARVVVGGHSFGANAGIGYAARREGVAGVLALGAGHTPEGRVFREALGNDVARARQLVAEGKGDEKTTFADINQGRRSDVRATAKVYLSHFDPEGPAPMSLNAPRIKGAVPVLWAIGEKDPLFQIGKPMIYDKIPPHPKSRYAGVPGGHAETPSESVAIVLEWLKAITD
jgi:pimeloyl-ACP methyl ester carboxylesterase